MRNWRQLVGERLQVDRYDRRISDAVLELASHLEETYQAARSSGIDEQSAFEIALQEVEDWHVLAVNISLAKEGSMNHRTRSLWLPALITLFGASVSLAAAQLSHVQPRLVWIGGWAITLYWQWLATLPVLGAAGAYLSQRSEGEIRARLAAGLSPALIMLIVMTLILPWALAIDGFHFFRLIGFGLGLINWVVIPATALLIGMLPFAFRNRPHQGLHA